MPAYYLRNTAYHQRTVNYRPPVREFGPKWYSRGRWWRCRDTKCPYTPTSRRQCAERCQHPAPEWVWGLEVVKVSVWQLARSSRGQGNQWRPQPKTNRAAWTIDRYSSKFSRDTVARRSEFYKPITLAIARVDGSIVGQQLEEVLE
jgi:hypothetical protein